jgi:hypothetical protein
MYRVVAAVTEPGESPRAGDGGVEVCFPSLVEAVAEARAAAHKAAKGRPYDLLPTPRTGSGPLARIRLDDGLILHLRVEALS